MIRTCGFTVCFWPHDTRCKLAHYIKSDNKIKQKVLHALSELHAKGYHHIILDIIKPADFWVAELLFKLLLANPEWKMKYTLRIISGFCEDWSDWSEDLPLDYEMVIRGAYKTRYVPECYIDNYIKLEALNLNENDNPSLDSYLEAKRTDSTYDAEFRGI